MTRNRTYYQCICDYQSKARSIPAIITPVNAEARKDNARNIGRDYAAHASARGGFRLYQMSDQEVHELYQTRAAIEGQMARIPAERHTPQDIAALRKTISEEENISYNQVCEYFEANRNILTR